MRFDGTFHAAKGLRSIINKKKEIHYASRKNTRFTISRHHKNYISRYFATIGCGHGSGTNEAFLD